MDFPQIQTGYKPEGFLGGLVQGTADAQAFQARDLANMYNQMVASRYGQMTPLEIQGKRGTNRQTDLANIFSENTMADRVLEQQTKARKGAWDFSTQQEEEKVNPPVNTAKLKGASTQAFLNASEAMQKGDIKTATEWVQRAQMFDHALQNELAKQRVIHQNKIEEIGKTTEGQLKVANVRSAHDKAADNMDKSIRKFAQYLVEHDPRFQSRNIEEVYQELWRDQKLASDPRSYVESKPPSFIERELARQQGQPIAPPTTVMDRYNRQKGNGMPMREEGKDGWVTLPNGVRVREKKEKQ